MRHATRLPAAQMLSVLRKLAWCLGVLVALWLTLVVYVHTAPAVVLHYSAAATAPVVYFYDEPVGETVKERIQPGESITFHIPHDFGPDDVITVSLPFASRDGVDLQLPFSRVDVYIGADTRIARTVIKTSFLARFGFD